MSKGLALVSRESVKKVFRNAQMGCPMDFIKHEESIEFINHEESIEFINHEEVSCFTLFVLSSVYTEA